MNTETNMTMKPCKFTFDDETIFEGFAHGSTWNGFDNVAVTPETLEQIKAHFDPETAEEFAELTAMENGLFPSVGVLQPPLSGHNGHGSYLA